MTLYANAMYRAHGRSRTDGWSILSDQIVFDQIPPGTLHNCTVKFSTPLDAIPTIFVEESPIVQINYTLKVHCSISGFLTGSVEIKLPTVISDQVPVFPNPAISPIIPPVIPLNNSVIPNAPIVPGQSPPFLLPSAPVDEPPPYFASHVAPPVSEQLNIPPPPYPKANLPPPYPNQ